MPKKIDHDKRKTEIMAAALEVYAKEGKNANLSLIASACGLSRTTVYQYFKDESQLYQEAVKYTTDLAFSKYSSEKWKSVSDPVEKLHMIANDIMNQADTYEKQVGNFLKMIDRFEDLPETVSRRTAKLNLFFARLIRQAIKDGKMKKCSPQDVADKLTIMLETYLFHMVYFPQNRQKVREIVNDLIQVNVI
ncbi:MAG: TetR/AcrR family transcriptional regulator [Spirochaetales bacterium]|jgi:AcrR family transcriptional regulator|nr:TetR/AcrR family transcriptional regulator [Spirochaetales bacterium]